MRRKEEFNKHQARRSFLRRIWIVALFSLFCLGLLFSRFAWLQVVHFDKYAQRADTNRIRIEPVAPTRGPIIDRNGVVLAYDAAIYTLEITPAFVVNLDETLEALKEFIPLTARDIRRFKQEVNKARLKTDNIPLFRNLTEEQVAALSANIYRFPGVEVNSRFSRRYPLQSSASHVLGYIGRITDADVVRLSDRGELDYYRGTQNIGRVGVEAQYESSLHGIAGMEENEVTAGGRLVRRLREISAKPGNTVQLTLDARLQMLVEELYGDRRGAFVAIDPRTGEILALVSKPTFNPNQFIEGFDHETWRAMSDSLNQPLFHRAIGGTYPIGSTYKPFMAMAGMQTGTRGPNVTIMDAGTFKLGNHVWRSPGGGTGRTDVRRGIIKSSNVYFYSLAYEMGVDKIHDFMKPWGFGQFTGIDLGGEVNGTLPSTEWKRNARASSPASERRWYDGETVNIGIGQGHNRFTILQLGSAVATLANRGQRLTPHILLNDKNIMTGLSAPYSNQEPIKMEVKPEFLNIVIEAMAEVPKQGTARFAFAGSPYTSGGKTGTAQASSVAQGQRYDPKVLAEYKRDHSLYITFAPVDNPKIAIAMIVENAGFGARSAVPIARRAMDFYLLGLYPSEEDMTALQQNYAGPPRGAFRTMDEFDIIPPEQLVPLSMVEADATEVNTWDQPAQSSAMEPVNQPQGDIEP